MGFFEDVSIGIPSVENIGIDFVVSAKKIQPIFAGIYRPTSKVVGLSPTAYTSDGSPWKISWRGRRFRERMLIKPYALYPLDIMGRRLASINKSHPRFGHSIVAKGEPSTFDSQIGPQLPVSRTLSQCPGCFGLKHGVFRDFCLPFDLQKSEYGDDNAANSDHRQGEVDPKSGFVITVLGRGRNAPYIGVNVILIFVLECWPVCLLWNNRRTRRG